MGFPPVQGYTHVKLPSFGFIGVGGGGGRGTCTIVGVGDVDMFSLCVCYCCISGEEALGSLTCQTTIKLSVV